MKFDRFLCCMFCSLYLFHIGLDRAHNIKSIAMHMNNCLVELLRKQNIVHGHNRKLKCQSNPLGFGPSSGK